MNDLFSVSALEIDALVHKVVRFCSQAVRLIGLGALILQGGGHHSLAQSSTNFPNTIVRFEIDRGTNRLGSMDVELFNRDKPETVRNFLLYLRSGAYTNTFFHRSITGFVVQGGGFVTTNRANATGAFSYREVLSFGNLTNEYNVGPQLSNVKGTIAMAKLGGDPNSATSQWFFNLGNNSTNLDNQNGGFTVFGQVVPSTNSSEGLQLLDHFNTLSTNAGIVNLESILGSAYSVFSSLPVSYTNSTTRAPTSQELYYLNITELTQTNTPTGLPPTVELLSPVQNARFTNQLVTIRGTAADDRCVDRVLYRIRGGASLVASGTTNWEFSFRPDPGLTTVTVESVDCDGNRSTNTASVTFLSVTTFPLVLQKVGSGTLTGLTNGQTLQAGRFYTLTAAAAPSFTFESWSGSFSSTSASITFQVPTTATNFALTAKFLGDPVPQLAGTYHGLFRATNSPSIENSGFLNLVLASDSTFRGTISHRGGSYSYSGRFYSSRSALVTGTIGGTSRSISLKLETTNTLGLITGSMLGSSVEVQLERLATALPSTNAPTLGPCTFTIEDLNNTPNQLVPGGDGFGTGNLDRNGILTLSGKLGDSAPFEVNVASTRFVRWPVYVNLFGGRGVVVGWLSSATNLSSGISGSLQWVKALDASEPLYPAGYTNQVSFASSPYTPPANGARVLKWINGVTTLGGADLFLAVSNLVKLSTNNAFSVVDSNPASLNLELDRKTGLINGSFIHPWSGTTNVLRGVVSQDRNVIRGQFLDALQTGSFSVDAASFLLLQPVTNLSSASLSELLSEGGHLRFDVEGTITLSEPLKVLQNTFLDANGHNIRFDGGGTTRLFEVSSNRVFSATGITFTNGRHAGTNGAAVPVPQPGGDGCGGGILNLGGTVSLTNCVLSHFVVQGGSAGNPLLGTNVVTGGRGMGAAICSRGGTINLINCQLSDNQAVGGSGGVALLAPSSILSAGGVGLGGAVLADRATCEIRETTFLRNLARGGERIALGTTLSDAADGAGGALAFLGGQLHIASSHYRSNIAAAASAILAGSGGGSAHGGALFLETGNGTVESTEFTDNAALGGQSSPGEAGARPSLARGGAVFNGGTLTITQSTVERATARGGTNDAPGAAMGGAIASYGSLVVDRSTLNDNRAEAGSPPTTGTNSIAGADAAGGAIYAESNFIGMTNSTVAFNQALASAGFPGAGTNPVTNGLARGGAVMLLSNTASLMNLTIARNSAEGGSPSDTNSITAFGGGIANIGAVVTLRNSILSSNAPSNHFGTTSDGGFNLSSDTTPFLTSLGSLINVDPLLGPLTTNGGPTLTMSPIGQSPARDAITSGWPSQDQRGTFRPQGPRGDIGAVEVIVDVPFFSVMPQGADLRRGTNYTLQASAIGGSTLSYFWQKDGAILPGATSSQLFLANLQSTNAGAYQIIATNSFGSTTSSVAVITIDLRASLLATSSGGNLTISSQGNPGTTYRLLCASNLSPNVLWIPIQTNISPPSGSLVWTLPIMTNGDAFYRAVSP